MAEWLFEAGIGEARAALVDDDRIIEAHVEWASDGPRVGAIVAAKLVDYGARGKGTVVAFGAPGSPIATLSGLPPATPIGATLVVEVTRMALAERGRIKPARTRLAEAGCAPGDGPDLRARIAASGIPVAVLASHGPDRLEAAGWSEALDQARTGQIEFPGGRLLVALTPAMTLIDIDGEDDAFALAKAGAQAAAQAIRRFGIGGSIGVDFPTLGGRDERLAVATTFDDWLPQPFERTAINGFGFLQIIRRRDRPSLIERVQLQPAESQALALLRRAGRVTGTGALTLTAAPTVTTLLETHPDWIRQLQTDTGRPVALCADPQMKGPGHAQ